MKNYINTKFLFFTFLFFIYILQEFIVILSTNIFEYKSQIFYAIKDIVVIISVLVIFLYFKYKKILHLFLFYFVLLSISYIVNPQPLNTIFIHALRVYLLPVCFFSLGYMIKIKPKDIRSIIILIGVLILITLYYEIIFRKSIFGTSNILNILQVKYNNYSLTMDEVYNYARYKGLIIFRPISIYLNTHNLSYFLLLPFSFLYFTNNKYFKLFSFFFALGIFLSFNRGSILGLFVIFIYYHKRHFIKMWFLYLILFTFLFIFIFLYINNKSMQDHLLEIRYAFIIGYLYPLGLGIGNGGISHFHNIESGSIQKIEGLGRIEFIHGSEGVFSALLREQGILTLLFLYILYLIYRRINDPLVKALYLAFLVSSIFSKSLLSFQASFILWVLLGGEYYYAKVKKKYN